MTRRRRLAAVALACALAVAGGTAAVSLAGDRQARIVVASADDAYVGVEPTDRTLSAGRHADVALLTIENRFPTALTTVDVSVGGDDPTPPVLGAVDPPADLAAGETGEVAATVYCSGVPDGGMAETWTLRVVASGDHVAVEFERPVTVTCLGPA